MIELLNESDIEYSSFNILSDEEVRQGDVYMAKHLRVWFNSQSVVL